MRAKTHHPERLEIYVMTRDIFTSTDIEDGLPVTTDPWAEDTIF